jgi:hypothetical protein
VALSENKVLTMVSTGSIEGNYRLQKTKVQRDAVMMSNTMAIAQAWARLDTEYLPGKKNSAADALSRNPRRPSTSS